MTDKMKKILTLCLTFMALTWLTACVDDDSELKQTVENDVLNIDLSIDRYPHVQVGATRAALEQAEENIPENVYVMLFDKDGRIIELEPGVFTAASAMTSYTDPKNPQLRAQYRVSLSVLRAHAKNHSFSDEDIQNFKLTAVSIGNMQLNSPEYWFGENGKLERLKDFVNDRGADLTLAALQQQVAYLAKLRRGEGYIGGDRNDNRGYVDDASLVPDRDGITGYDGLTERAQGLLMSGLGTQTVNAASVRGATVPVKLTRVDAKVEIRIKSGNPNLRFLPRGVRFHNMPTGSYLMADANRATYFDQDLYNPAAMSWRQFEYEGKLEEHGLKSPRTGNDSLVVADIYTGDDTNVSGIVFYMPEVKLKAKKKINAAEWDAKYSKIFGSGSSVTSIEQFDEADRLRYLYGMRARLEKKANAKAGSGAVTFNPQNGQYYHNGQPLTNLDDSGNFLPFEYAPDKAVWVEIVGDVYETVTSGVAGVNQMKKERVAHNVVYRLLLGGNAESEDGINSYSISRDKYYTYNVSIYSLEDIKAEVRVNNLKDENRQFEDNSHDDAFVTEASTAILDSHFDARAVLINFFDLRSKMSVSEWQNINPTAADDALKHFEVNTPFDPLPQGGGSNDYVASKTDTAWVSFFIHPLTHIYSSQYASQDESTPPRIPRFTIGKPLAYEMFPPQDDRYKDCYRKGPQDLIRYIRLAMKDLTTKWKNYTASDLMSSPEFKKDLEKWHFDSETGDMIISVHAHEFYYDEMPSWATGFQVNGSGTAFTVNSTNWENNGWRLFVNRPDRMMKIFFSDRRPSYSSDGHSSWDDAEINVQQHSIMAPYNIDRLPQDYVGYGVELVEEEEWMENKPDNITASSKQLRQAHCHVWNENYYVPVQGTTNIYDGRLLFTTLVHPGWLDGSHKWKDLLDYTFSGNNENARVYIPRGSIENRPGYVYQWQIIYPRHINNGSFKSQGGWAGLAVLSRNEPSNPYDLQSGMIYDKDVKWYLPSLPQLEYLWMAQVSLAPAYRLRNDYPYITSTRLTKSDDGPWSEPFMFMARYGATMRQKMAEARSHLVRWPWAWDLGDIKTRYYYGYQSFNQPMGGSYDSWKSQYRDEFWDAPLRVRAVRTLGKYDPNKIYRPAQRWLTESNDWTRDTSVPANNNEGGVSTSGLIIDCSRFPSDLIRQNYVANGPLPKHTMNSVWARPYKYFRVARLSVAVTKRSLGWGKDQYVYRMTTDFGYPARTTNPDYKSVYDAEASRPSIMLDDSRDEHPCAHYIEVDRYTGKKIIRGWRMPNAYELMLMIRLFPPQQMLDMRTQNWNPTWWTASNGWGVGSENNWSSNNNPTTEGRIETLSTSSNNVAYYMTKTDTEEGYRFYGAHYWAQQYGFRARPMDLNRWTRQELVKMTGGSIWLTEFDVRCVKDVSDTEMQQYITNQGGSSSHDDFIKPY